MEQRKDPETLILSVAARLLCPQKMCSMRHLLLPKQSLTRSFSGGISTPSAPAVCWRSGVTDTAAGKGKYGSFENHWTPLGLE